MCNGDCNAWFEKRKPCGPTCKQGKTPPPPEDPEKQRARYLAEYEARQAKYRALTPPPLTDAERMIIIINAGRYSAYY